MNTIREETAFLILPAPYHRHSYLVRDAFAAQLHCIVEFHYKVSTISRVPYCYLDFLSMSSAEQYPADLRDLIPCENHPRKPVRISSCLRLLSMVRRLLRNSDQNHPA